MRNDNLFFKRVPDILIPYYPLSLACKNEQKSKRQVLTSFSPVEKLSINCDCSRKSQSFVSLYLNDITLDLVCVVTYKLLNNKYFRKWKYENEEEFLNIPNVIIFYILLYIVELIILLLVNLFLKTASHIVQMYIHISKKGINISLHIHLNVLRKFMILFWATLIAVPHTRVGQPWPRRKKFSDLPTSLL